MKNYVFTVFFAVSLLVLNSCSNSERVVRDKVVHSVYIPNEFRTNESINAVVEKYKSFQKEVHLFHDLSDFSSDLLKKSSTLSLLKADLSSFTPFIQSLIERYTEAGGGLVMVEEKPALNYQWDFYNKIPNVNSIKLAKARNKIVRHETVDSYLNACNGDLLEMLQGDNSYNYSLCKNPQAPDPKRFSKVLLADDLYEPMEMVVLPDRKVLFLERRGSMKLYDPYEKETRVVANFDVCIEGNYEDGLHGLALDPDYKNNHYLYMYYSPPCEIDSQYLSRFIFKNDTISKSSEKIILRVGVQRETCCHSGGSVEFGPDGLIYLSTGDNTSSKESDGMTPIDERVGRAPFDAQKSSGNTHDLRGKILRIKLTEDGSYTIPEGNLFPADGSGGRPEIYIMGARNPFRMTIDPKTNYLYWGDVGPDGGKANKYGPESFDEWNQAKEAGNYGWPYFVGANYAYPDRDFEKDEVGKLFDPNKPVNQSPNNTGDEILPPAQLPMIWYPYGNSEEFPLLGSGGRSACAGPFYYSELVTYSNSKTKFPKYLDGKLLIYEWVRNWIMAISFDEEGNMIQMERLFEDLEFFGPVEIEFGPDGALYVLEYGNGYFLKNPQASLSRIEFAEGNRNPVAQISYDVEPIASTPLKVNFSAEESYDQDGDSLTYAWSLSGSDDILSTEKNFIYNFTENGVFEMYLDVEDAKGNKDKATQKILLGNDLPEINIGIAGNQSFFFPNKSINYNIAVNDKEDEASGKMNIKDAITNIAYISNPDYLNDLLKGKKQLPEGAISQLEGLRQLNASDCRTCHHEEKESIGPTYKEVAEKYADDANALSYLSKKIRTGGSGIWGKSMMAAHPSLDDTQVKQMASYILSLSNQQSFELSGSHLAEVEEEAYGGYIISNTYIDQGANGIPSQKLRAHKILRNPKVQAEHRDLDKGVWESRFGSALDDSQLSLRKNSFLAFKEIDLTSIKSLNIKFNAVKSGSIKIKLNDPKGKVIGAVSFTGKYPKDVFKELSTSIASQEGVHDIYFVGDANSDGAIGSIDWIEFNQ